MKKQDYENIILFYKMERQWNKDVQGMLEDYLKHNSPYNLFFFLLERDMKEGKITMSNRWSEQMNKFFIDNNFGIKIISNSKNRGMTNDIKLDISNMKYITQNQFEKFLQNFKGILLYNKINHLLKEANTGYEIRYKEQNYWEKFVREPKEIEVLKYE